MSQRRWTILELLRETTEYFKKKGIEAPRSEAEILLAHTLGLRRIDLYLRHDQPLSPEELASFREVVRRRIAREPSQYIIGSKEFWSMDFEVNPSVLIPRPETELLVEKAIECILTKGYRRILEIGTGSGAIIIAIVREIPLLSFSVATDISPEAIAVARRNALRHGVLDRIAFLVADLFSAFKNGPTFDLIVSNPPYISDDEYRVLAPEIRNHEPSIALLGGGADGADNIRAILTDGWYRLRDGGMMLIEIGHNQAKGLMSFFKEMVNNKTVEDGPYRLSIIKDYSGWDRILCVEKSK
ncbi:MAG: peptide chain release factor N(5)-glutamine methyltransferase [Syntrophobacterales bacterium]|nr:peptide chain release factor N(5)-glutamine methyltransferase [Syntrophobacterales bacterium]